MSRAGAQANRTADGRVATTRSPWRAVAVFVVVAVALGLLALATSLALLDEANGTGAGVADDLVTGLALGVAGLAAVRFAGPTLLPPAVGRAQHRAHTVLGFASGVFFLLALWACTQHGWTGFGAVAGVPFVVWALVELAAVLAAEYGWRGVLQPLLENKMPRTAAALLVGVAWWLWQLPVLMTGGEAVLRLLSTLVLSMLLGFLGNGSPWQRALPAGLARWMMVIAAYQFAGDDVIATDGWWARHLLAAVITTAVFLAMFVIATRRRRARTAAASA